LHAGEVSAAGIQEEEWALCQPGSKEGHVRVGDILEDKKEGDSDNEQDEYVEISNCDPHTGAAGAMGVTSAAGAMGVTSATGVTSAAGASGASANSASGSTNESVVLNKRHLCPDSDDDVTDCVSSLSSSSTVSNEFLSNHGDDNVELSNMAGHSKCLKEISSILPLCVYIEHNLSYTIDKEDEEEVKQEEEEEEKRPALRLSKSFILKSSVAKVLSEPEKGGSSIPDKMLLRPRRASRVKSKITKSPMPCRPAKCVGGQAHVGSNVKQCHKVFLTK